MAAPDQMPNITEPLVTREPSIHGAVQRRGANGRNAIGATVMGGTIASTAFGILFAPLFYVLMRRLLGRKNQFDEQPA